MSAAAAFSLARARRRFGLFENVAAAGLPAALAVAVGGLGAGTFLWYAALTHRTLGATLSDAVLPLALVIGVVVTFALWVFYANYFAQRADVDVATALRYDAASWALFALAGIGVVVPVAFGSPPRVAALALGLFAVAKLAAAARFVPTVRDVLVAFAVTRLAIGLVAELAAIVIAQRPGTHVAVSSNPALAVWGRWDAVHYLQIAQHGYYGTDMAFFPLYPALIRIVGGVLGSDVIGGLLVSNVALFFGLLFFYKLVEHQYTRSVARRAIFYVSIFPTAVYFSAVYTESLFFALTVASFYYIREHRWVAAGILGFFAALTRVEGILLFVPYAIEAIAAAREGRAWSPVFATPSRALRMLVGAVLIPLGLGAFMAILWVLRGDPLYFSHIQTHWDRKLAPPWASLTHAYREIVHGVHGHGPVLITGQVIEVAFTLLMVGVLLAGLRRLRPSFSVYMVLSILVPMSTSSLMSMPRFALVMFPMFMILALWGGKPWVNNTVVALSLPLLGLFTVLFTNWYWVA